MTPVPGGLSRGPITVLADDISGAAELAGLAFAHGLAAEVQTDFDPASPADVIALDTDTRCLPLPEAEKTLRRMAQKVRDARPRWIYMKTDSVLRGHVRAEVSALLETLALSRAVLIPANPGRRRIIRDGRYYVDGQPLDRTVFAQDPEHPARSADVQELLQRETGAAIRSGAPNSEEEGGIFVPDVSSREDLVRHAASLDTHTLPAGAAEFFMTLLEQREPRPPGSAPLQFDSHQSAPSLWVCGSAAAWPSRFAECGHRQVAQLTLPSALFDSAQGTKAPEILSRLAAGAAASIRKSGQVLLAIGTPTLPTQCTPSRLVEALAEAVAQVLAVQPVERLFLEGGATAAAVLRRLGWKRLRVKGHFAPGLARFYTLENVRTAIGIKPGSYPWPVELWSSIEAEG